MKKLITGITFFVLGFSGVLLINYLAVEHPISVLINGDTNLQAFVSKWELGGLYNFSRLCIGIGIVLLLLEPGLHFYSKLKPSSK